MRNRVPISQKTSGLNYPDGDISCQVVLVASCGRDTPEFELIKPMIYYFRGMFTIKNYN